MLAAGGWGAGAGTRRQSLQMKILNKTESSDFLFSFFSMLFVSKGNLLDLYYPLRKHAYSSILKILPPKNENFQTKNPDIFHTSPQNIDCGYSLEPPHRGGSNEYPQSMF